MTSEQFTYWLQGFVELNPSMAHPTAEQWKSITEHLQTVFVKVTPPVAQPVVSPGVSDLQKDAMRRFNEQLKRPYDPLAPGWPGVVTC